MTSARLKILALLATRFDFLPGPETWRANPLCARQPSKTASALVPSAREDPCRRCQGLDKNGRRKCPRCKGRGWLWVDAYDAEQRPLGDEQGGPTRAMSASEMDGLLAQLEDARPPEEVDRLAEAIDRRDRAGSYHELEVALFELRRVSMRHYRAVTETPPRGQAALLFLEVRMELLTGGRIRAPRWALEDPPLNGHAPGPAAAKARTLRAERIAAMRETMTVEEICRAVGLQKSQVYELLGRLEEGVAA